MNPITNLLRGISVHPLTRDHRARALGRVVGWQVRSRIHDEVIVPWVAGQKLALKRGMNGATGNLYVGLVEFTDMVFLLHFLRPDDLFIDIGANVGVYTVLASGACRARTIAFEPDDDAFLALWRNIGVNNIGDLVDPRQCAIGPAEATIAFTVGRDTKNRAAIDGEASRSVRQMPLDAVIGDSKPTFIKLDVEGYEAEVLAGASKTLRKKSLQVVATETTRPSIADLLAANGFKPVYYEPFKRSITSELIGFPASNMLFVRDPAFVAKRVSTALPVEVLNRSI